MKVVQTKIYLKFIAWFILVSLLPLAALFVAIYTFDPAIVNMAGESLQRAVLIGVFLSLALVFLLSLAAARRLSLGITNPIQATVKELSVVVDSLFKSVQRLNNISRDNDDLAKFLRESSQNQQTGLKSGSTAVTKMVKSLDNIADKLKTTDKDTSKIDELAKQGEIKSQSALDGLVAIRHLATENQKLNQALDQYADQVKKVAQKVSALAENAKFLSLNASIEANKTAFTEEFSSLVAQIRELNTTSGQAAIDIDGLAGDMQRQIKQSRQSSVYESEETTKSIETITQTIDFLSKILAKIANISKSVSTINKETQQTRSQAGNIEEVIKDLNKEAKNLVKQVNHISETIEEEIIIAKSLDRSSSSLNKASDNLNNLLGKSE